MIETNPYSADAEELELGASAGEEDVSKTDNLGTQLSAKQAEYYQKLTGREDIKTKEDFEKHYEGLKSLVGDQKIAELRKKAEKYDALQAEIRKEADEFLKTPEGQAIEKEFAKEAMEDRISSLENEIKIQRFLKNYPEAEPIVDLVQAKASRNEVSLEEAYSKVFGDEKYSLQDLLRTKLEVEKSKAEEKSIGVESKSRIALNEQAELNQLVKEVQEKDTLEAKQKLVEKALGLSK